MQRWVLLLRWGCLNVQDNITCPVCGKEDHKLYEGCSRCGWDLYDDQNIEALNKAKKDWQKLISHTEIRLSHKIDWEKQDGQKQE